MVIDYGDLINGFFEMFGGILYTLNIRAILKHKEVKGMSLLPNLFFTCWAIFNLWFYSNHDLWFSFIGGIFLGLSNSTWFILAIYYKYYYNLNRN